MINDKNMFNRCVDCGNKIHRKSKRCRACSISSRNKSFKGSKHNDISFRNALRMFQRSNFTGTLKDFLDRKKLNMVLTPVKK